MESEAGRGRKNPAQSDGGETDNIEEVLPGDPGVAAGSPAPSAATRLGWFPNGKEDERVLHLFLFLLVPDCYPVLHSAPFLQLPFS